MSSPPAPQPFSPNSPPPLAAAADDYVDAGARAIDLSERPVADSLREIMASSPRLAREQPPTLPPARPMWINRHWTLAILGLLLLASAFAMAGETVWRVGAGGLDALAPAPAERARLLIAHPVRVGWLLALGLGLILARRWARHLCLASLVAVVLWSLVSATAVVVDTGLPWEAWASVVMARPVWMPLAVLGGGALAAWILIVILSHHDVRLTCEVAQPKADWTDQRSPSELILFVLLMGLAFQWGRLASFHPWPYWGVWRMDSAPWIWGGAGAAAAGVGALVAMGRPAGAWLALGLVATGCSSLVVTAQHEPADTFTAIWDGWRFGTRGGCTYLMAGALALAAVAGGALRAACRRRRGAASRSSAPLTHS
ncbi:MAG: hypothetical protein ACKV19_26435 [Verrucomicrobiales bacterium]